MLAIETICREICFYPENERIAVIRKITNDVDLPETVKEIMSFLIVNAPLLTSHACTSDLPEIEPVSTSRFQKARQLSA